MCSTHCPVSPTFTDAQFEVPMGCQEVRVDAQTMRGRGVVTTNAPTQGNSMIGSLHIEDTAGGPAVYDVRVSLTCIGGESSTPHHPVRLSCVHNSGAGGETCHMGRIEVWSKTRIPSRFARTRVANLKNIVQTRTLCMSHHLAEAAGKATAPTRLPVPPFHPLAQGNRVWPLDLGQRQPRNDGVPAAGLQCGRAVHLRR